MKRTKAAQSSLTDDQVDEMRRLYKRKPPTFKLGNTRELAEKFGVPINLVRDIVSRKSRGFML